MILKKLFKHHKIKVKDFSSQNDIPIASMYRYLRGKKVENYQRAKIIHEVLNKEISIEDLMR
jgi:predicted transcriptional regulator